METQLELEFDTELGSILRGADQREIIKGLVKLYIQFITIENKKKGKNTEVEKRP